MRPLHGRSIARMVGNAGAGEWRVNCHPVGMIAAAVVRTGGAEVIRYPGRRGRLIALMAFTAMGAGLLGAPAALADDSPYVSLGDSVGAGFGASTSAKGFVPILGSALSASSGATRVLNLAQGGATSGSLRTGGQLSAALAEINGASDTAAVTIEIGGNDLLGGGPCPGNWDDPSCPYRANFALTLDDLQAALAADPGAEPFATMMYYNPGTGTASEANYDAQLFGANGILGLSDTGADVGLNDVILQESTSRAIPVANPYPAFDAAGQTFMYSDQIHPNDAGHAAIAQAFCDALAISCSASPPGMLPGTPPAVTPPVVDRSAPGARLTRSPKKKSVSHRAKFKFRSDDPTAMFECKLDRSRWKGCRSPKKIRVTRGKHRFSVRAVDPAGNVGSAVRYGFKVKKSRRK